MSRGGGGGGGGSSSSTGRRSRKHPLSRSQSATTPEEEEADGGDYASDDLPAARRQKTSSYGVLGVSAATAADPTSGYMFPPPTRHPGLATITDVPLFAGPTDSRNFSLGRWELRKPSAAVPSRREMLARQVEEQQEEEEEEEEKKRARGAWVYSATEATIAPSPFLLNSSEFLFEAGLEPPPPPPPTGGATGLVDPRATVLQPPLASSSSSSLYACATAPDPHDDASTEYGTAYSSSSVFDASWQSDAASSSVYYDDTAPSSSSAWSARSPTRMTMPAAASESLASKDPYGLFRHHQPIWSAASVGPSLFAAQQQHNNNHNQHLFAPESGGGLGYEPLSATATAGGGVSPGAGGEEDLFHFGAEDLFAQPPPALSLFDHDPSARTVSSMFDPTSPGAGLGDERLGLGIAL